MVVLHIPHPPLRGPPSPEGRVIYLPLWGRWRVAPDEAYRTSGHPKTIV